MNHLRLFSELMVLPGWEFHLLRKVGINGSDITVSEIWNKNESNRMVTTTTEVSYFSCFPSKVMARETEGSC